MITLALGAGLQAGEVRAGIGLRIALGPEMVGAEDGRQEAALLVVAAEGVDDRSDIGDAHRDEPGCAFFGEGLLEQPALQRLPPLAAPFAGPMAPHPAAGMENLLPALVIGAVQHEVLIDLAADVLRQGLAAEGPDLLTECLKLSLHERFQYFVDL